MSDLLSTNLCLNLIDLALSLPLFNRATLTPVIRLRVNLDAAVHQQLGNVRSACFLTSTIVFYARKGEFHYIRSKG